jgi:hypothetical protein
VIGGGPADAGPLERDQRCRIVRAKLDGEETWGVAVASDPGAPRSVGAGAHRHLVRTFPASPSTIHIPTRHARAAAVFRRGRHPVRNTAGTTSRPTTRRAPGSLSFDTASTKRRSTGRAGDGERSRRSTAGMTRSTTASSRPTPPVSARLDLGPSPESTVSGCIAKTQSPLAAGIIAGSW